MNEGSVLLQALERLRELPSLVDVNIPLEEHFTVCGDVHGQFFDLLNIFELNGLPSPQNPYLFNGELNVPPRSDIFWLKFCPFVSLSHVQ